MAKKLKWNLILMSVLYLGLGIFLLMRPSTALNVVCYALGGVVLVCAAANIANVLAKGTFPQVDNPAAIPIILASAIPQSICLSGNSFLKMAVFVAAARSASSTTISSCSFASSTSALP